MEQAPDRFTIVPADIIPDDELVAYAGTAEDGRKFFLSDEFFVPGYSGPAYVGLFLWNADGTFHEVHVDEIPWVDVAPFDNAYPGAQDLLDARLTELGDHVIEAIEVEPFTTEVDGVTFGWALTQDEESGSYNINAEPGTSWPTTHLGTGSPTTRSVSEAGLVSVLPPAEAAKRGPRGPRRPWSEFRAAADGPPVTQRGADGEEPGWTAVPSQAESLCGYSSEVSNASGS